MRLPKKLEKPPRKAPPRPQAKKYRFRDDLTPVLSPDNERSPFYYNLFGGRKDTGNIGTFIAGFGLAGMGAQGVMEWMKNNAEKLKNSLSPEGLGNFISEISDTFKINTDEVEKAIAGTKEPSNPSIPPPPPAWVCRAHHLFHCFEVH